MCNVLRRGVNSCSWKPSESAFQKSLSALTVWVFIQIIFTPQCLKIAFLNLEIRKMLYFQNSPLPETAVQASLSCIWEQTFLALLSFTFPFTCWQPNQTQAAVFEATYKYRISVSFHNFYLQTTASPPAYCEVKCSAQQIEYRDAGWLAFGPTRTRRHISPICPLF